MAHARLINQGILTHKSFLFTAYFFAIAIIIWLQNKFSKFYTAPVYSRNAHNNVVWQFAENLFVISSALTSFPDEEQPR